MARWGLRWIFCWLSVLVTACSQLASPTPADKPENRTPLQGFTPPATASPSVTYRPAYTLTPLGSVRPTHAASLEPLTGILLQSPSCYESPAQSLVCLGWIQNTGDTPLSNVVIDIYLLNLQGQPLSILETTPVFNVLFPKSGSPYRGVFSTVPEEEWHVDIKLRYVEPQLPLMSLQQIMLIAQNIRAEWLGTSYEVRGEIFNRGDFAVDEVRIVVMIWDHYNTLLGYRVLDITEMDKQLFPGEFLAFQVNVAPLTGQIGQNIAVLSHGTILN